MIQLQSTIAKHLGDWPVRTIGLFAVAVALVIWLSRRQRYPDVPVLRISKKPWILGQREDERLWVTNAITILLKGYEQYSSRNINYLVRRPEGKLLIVAPKFVEEVRRAPETHVQNHPANNDVSFQQRNTSHDEV